MKEEEEWKTLANSCVTLIKAHRNIWSLNRNVGAKENKKDHDEGKRIETRIRSRSKMGIAKGRRAETRIRTERRIAVSGGIWPHD